jgi:hypothetical protein
MQAPHQVAVIAVDLAVIAVDLAVMAAVIAVDLALMDTVNQCGGWRPVYFRSSFFAVR